MKILRPAAAVAALTASFAFSAHSHAADADATNVSPQAASQAQTLDSIQSVAQTFEQIRTDVTTAEFTGDEMLNRIDSLVNRIDSLMKTTVENNGDLTQLRNASLQMRGEVVEFLSGNGQQLVQFQPSVPPVGDVIQGMDGSFVEGSGQGTTPGGFVSSNTISGGGASGGGAAGGGSMFGGGGSFGMLGGIAAAAAVAIDDDNNVGPVASQSTP